MELKDVNCPACGGRDFTLEEVVEDDELTGVDLWCARGCGFYSYEAGDRCGWSSVDGKAAAAAVRRASFGEPDEADRCAPPC